MVITVVVGVIVSAITQYIFVIKPSHSYQEVSKEGFDAEKPKKIGLIMAEGREFDVKLLALK